MTDTTRRNVLAASASLGAGLAASPLLAQTSPAPAASTATRQAPGFYRMKVGEAEITVLHDGFVARRAEGMVRNVALPEVETQLRSSFIDPNALENPYNFAVVRTGGKTYAIDAGFADNGSATTGQAAANMRAAGIDPDAIDAVIVSHFHPDHIAGIRRKDGTLAFGKAEIHVPEAEWAYWMDDAQMAQAPEARRNAFTIARRVFAPVAGQVRRFSGEREVVPGILSVPTPGHSPGHMSFIVASGNAKVLIQGDVSGNPWLFVQNPGWHSSFDQDAQLAEATRRRIYDMAAVERMPIVGYHFPFPAVGMVAKEGNGYRFGLANWRSVV